MDIDSYQQCPCQSGKKIKFCCGKEVIHDLDEILSKTSSGQTQAALDQLDRTIAKAGPKDCLLVIKTHILISRNEIEKALEANQQFRELAPGHPMGLQHLAVLHLAQGDLEGGIQALQDAMDSIKGADIPLTMANVFRIIGGLLYEHGRIIGALAHLHFVRRLRNELDRSDAALLNSILGDPNSFPFVCQPLGLDPPPAGVEWEKLYTNVSRAITRGQFRKALQILTKIDTDTPDQPCVVRALAIVKSFLGRDDAADAWRRYATHSDTPPVRAVEALAIAYEEDDSWYVQLPIEKVLVELPDFERASEILLSSDRTTQFELPPTDPDVPRPRFCYFLLDKPALKSMDDVTLETLPRTMTELLVYGKQTDRPACIVFHAPPAHQEEILGQLRELLGEDLGEPQVEPFGDSIEQDVLFSRRPSFPREATAEACEPWDIAVRRDNCVQHWPQLRLDADHDISVAQAAQDPQLQPRVWARLMILISNSRGQFLSESIYQELLEQLALPPLEPLGPDQPGALSSPVCLLQMDLSKLTLEQLETARKLAMQIHDLFNLRRVLKEYLGRDDRNRQEDQQNHLILARACSETAESIEIYRQARQLAQESSDREAYGVTLVEELELRLYRGWMSETEALFAEARQYLDIDQVKFMLTRLLSQLGILNDRTPLSQMAAPAPVAAAGEERASTIITESSSPTPAAKESKLWLPD